METCGFPRRLSRRSAVVPPNSFDRRGRAPLTYGRGRRPGPPRVKMFSRPNEAYRCYYYYGSLPAGGGGGGRAVRGGPQFSDTRRQDSGEPATTLPTRGDRWPVLFPPSRIRGEAAEGSRPNRAITCET